MSAPVRLAEAFVEALVWLLLFEVLLVMIVIVLGLVWTVTYCVYAVRRAVALAAGPLDDKHSSAARHRPRPAPRPWSSAPTNVRRVTGNATDDRTGDR